MERDEKGLPVEVVSDVETLSYVRNSGPNTVTG